MVDPKGYLTDLNSITPQTSGDIKSVAASLLFSLVSRLLRESPHSQASFPGLIPRPHSQASFPGPRSQVLIPGPHSQVLMQELAQYPGSMVQNSAVRIVSFCLVNHGHKECELECEGSILRNICSAPLIYAVM